MEDNSFFSIDRLVEFGLGLSVARQMVDVMYNTIQNAVIPGAAMPQQNRLNNLYCGIDGKSTGPYTETEFMQLIAQKKVSKDTLVWKPGMSNWQTVENTPSVLRLIALTPPPMPK